MQTAKNVSLAHYTHSRSRDAPANLTCCEFCSVINLLSAPHHINGIGPRLVTNNFSRVRDLVDDIFLIDDDVAFDWTRSVSRAEGLIIGSTSGATVWGAAQVLNLPDRPSKKIVCFFYDSGERYLSVDGLF